MSDDSPEPRLPPRYIPTLTEVVHLNGEHAPVVKPAAAPPANLAALPAQTLAQVMQQVDTLLEQRLREATSRLVASQTQQLLEQLRPALHRVVEQTLQEVLRTQTPDASP